MESGTGDVAKLKSASLRVETVCTVASFARVRNDWGRLMERAAASVFLSWEWLYPWLVRVAPERAPQILLARDPQGELVGLLPLAAEARRLGARTTWRLAFLGESRVGSDFLGMVSAPGWERPVAKLFADSLAAARWDLLDLSDLEEGSLLEEEIRGRLGEVSWVRTERRFECPCEEFHPGTTFDGYLAGRARRANYLRRKRWFERQPGFAIERTTDDRDLQIPMAEFFRLHTARWEGESRPQGIRGTDVRAFHRDAFPLLAALGKAQLFTLRVRGVAVASVYALIHGGRFYYFQAGYDPNWAAKSPGLVLVGETFREALARGLGAYDFLRGTEPYKFDWTSSVRRTVRLRFWRRDGKGSFLLAQQKAGALARQAVKAVLPPSWIQAARRHTEERPPAWA